MILAEELKKAVLQAAIQGKLVEQRMEEGTGEELYEKIQREKEKLIKQGIIKKENILPEITEDEIPFDIPEHWKWVRLSDISQSIADGDHQPPPQTISGVPFIVISNLSSGKISFNNVRHVPKMYYDDLQPSRKPSKGDILFTVTGSYGISVMVETETEFCFQRHMALIKHLIVDGRYLLNALSSPAVREQCKSVATGTAQKTVGITSLKKILLPLPPLGEQKRISEKLGKILPEIEGYAIAEEKLTDLQSSFPNNMRKSILQYAMQGKLVEQRPEEGTGEDLFQRIQAEKETLIREGKIKKEKPLPKIAYDEIPFDIPDSWKWVYVADIFEHNTGKAQNASVSSNGTIRKFITTSNLYWDRFDFTKVKEMPFTDQELERCTVVKGDLLVCEGGDFGRAAVWNYDEEVCIQNHVHRLRPYAEVNIRFFYYLFFLYKNSGRLKGQGIAIQGLSTKAMHVLKFPLPPLGEQRRIVERLERILPHIEELKETQ